MANKGGGDGWWWLLALLALGGLAYYSQTGKEEGQDSALIPNRIEDPIDRLVALLNQRFGPQWVDAGVYAIRLYLRSAAPELLSLVDAVAAAEQRYKGVPKSGPLKKREVMQQLMA
jgi:hypothetical protein